LPKIVYVRWSRWTKITNWSCSQTPDQVYELTFQCDLVNVSKRKVVVSNRDCINYLTFVLIRIIWDSSHNGKNLETKLRNGIVTKINCALSRHGLINFVGNNPAQNDFPSCFNQFKIWNICKTVQLLTPFQNGRNWEFRIFCSWPLPTFSNRPHKKSYSGGKNILYTYNKYSMSCSKCVFITLLPCRLLINIIITNIN
jgi:hypothetical protein